MDLIWYYLVLYKFTVGLHFKLWRSLLKSFQMTWYLKCIKHDEIEMFPMKWVRAGKYTKYILPRHESSNTYLFWLHNATCSFWITQPLKHTYSNLRQYFTIFLWARNEQKIARWIFVFISWAYTLTTVFTMNSFEKFDKIRI